MAVTSSTTTPLGKFMPAFELADFGGARWRGDHFSGAAAVVVAFICCDCPFVRHVRPELARLAEDYAPRGVAFVGVDSNIDTDEAACCGGPIAARALAGSLPFPYLLDPAQTVARAFGAVCTPDLFVFGPDRRLAYRGQVDDSRPRRDGEPSDLPLTGADLRMALDSVLAAQAPRSPHKPSVGCAINWR